MSELIIKINHGDIIESLYPPRSPLEKDLWIKPDGEKFIYINNKWLKCEKIIDEALHTELQIRATKEGMTLIEAINEAIQNWLDERLENEST